MSGGFKARDAEPTMTMSVYSRYTFSESLSEAGTTFKLGVVDLDTLCRVFLAFPRPKGKSTDRVDDVDIH